MKFDVGILYNNLSSKLAFYENQLSDGYVLLDVVKGICTCNVHISLEISEKFNIEFPI
jgi:hypothetical protein